MDECVPGPLDSDPCFEDNCCGFTPTGDGGDCSGSSGPGGEGCECVWGDYTVTCEGLGVDPLCECEED